MNETLSYKINNLRHLAENEYHNIKSLNNSDERYAMLEKDKAYKGIEFEVNKIFSDNREIFYIPAGRGLLSLLTDQLLLIDVKLLDYISGNFMKLIQEKRKNFDQELEIFRDIEFYKNIDTKQKRDMLQKQITTILKGKYYFKNGKEYIRIGKGSSILINYASSGQQEVVWILNLLFLWSLQEEKSFFIVIEEPEAHLYPDTQKTVLDYIAMFSNVSSNQIMITTHSPYILTSANNLLYAGKVGSKSERVDKIIQKDKWLNIAHFDSYLVGQNPQNYVRSIIDNELNEIAAEEIDKISKALRNDYAEIFNLEAHDEFTK